ncbi:MAG: prenyltransferase [Candidatus Bathyarchaeia archaeon]
MLTLRLTRFPFLVATLPTIFLASSLVLFEHGALSWVRLIITTVGLVSAQLASNTANDYWDEEADSANQGFTRFSGGSRVLPEGLLTRGYVRKVYVGLYVLAFACGLFLAYTNPWILPLIGLGFFFSYFYTAPPLRLGYRYVGEVVVGLNFGWLMSVGVYMVQYATPSLTLHLLSLIPSITVALILLINEFPDYEYDKACKKKNLIVLLGRERGAVLYSATILSVHLLLTSYVLIGVVGPQALLGLFTLPLAAFAAFMTGVKRCYDDPVTLERVQAITIVISVATSVLVGLGLLL